MRRWVSLAIFLLLAIKASAQFGTPRDLAFWGKKYSLGFCENPYTLPSLAGLIWHLDASTNVTSTNGAFPSDGHMITNWSDTINGQVFTSLDPARQPVWEETGTNNHPAIRFNTSAGSDPYMTNFNGVTYAQPNTVFFVVNVSIPGSSSWGQTLIDSGTSGRELMWINNSTGNLGFYAGTLVEGSSIGAPPLTTHWFVYSSQFNGANSFLRTNGITYVTGNPGAGGSEGGFSLGGYYGQGWGGRVAEGLFYNAALTTNEMRQVENYLMGKYCIPVP